MTTRPGRRMIRRLGQVAGWALLVGVVVVLWPAHLGGCTTLTIVTGHSMEPTLQPGDLAIARCGTPHVGEVVAYRPFPDKAPVVIHRIIGGDGAAGYLLQGDNNHFIDPFKPVAAQVRGVTIFSVPKVGGVLSFLGSPLIWISTLLVAGAVLLWPGRADDSEPGNSADQSNQPAEDNQNELVAA